MLNVIPVLYVVDHANFKEMHKINLSMKTTLKEYSTFFENRLILHFNNSNQTVSGLIDFHSTKKI